MYYFKKGQLYKVLNPYIYTSYFFRNASENKTKINLNCGDILVYLGSEIKSLQNDFLTDRRHPTKYEVLSFLHGKNIFYVNVSLLANKKDWRTFKKSFQRIV